MKETDIEVKYDLNPTELYNFLQKKNIKYLYHANTVATSLLYVEQKSLLSRQYVEDNNLYQTAQYTDAKDKILGIYDDIFLDMVDIHSYLSRPNFYGPFLFVFDSDILISGLIKVVRITKKNPSNWNPEGDIGDWYYSSIDDLEADYMRGDKISDVGKMIILRDLQGKIPIVPYCSKIMLDNPNLHISVEEKEFYLINVIKEYFDSFVLNPYYEKIIKEVRHKDLVVGCSCWSKYESKFKKELKDFRRLFHKTPAS
ncbi:hypothetical protein [Flavobacterium sp. 2]|uniref:hypothetical protein n=1 Tax=Flavobacterium sp. 2 TaxID=308053 RepID=UPI000C193484|nr:hypothetical protein [Flavobacterium sp. 2]PIF71305.1 hypothetical protein CLU99_2071 [Flavobacterium sp. 2]